MPENSDWSWKLRLFTSADLVGSTAYKQSKSSESQEWARTFKEFFKSFPESVSAAYAVSPERCPLCPAQLVPWKFSGDEILFSVKLEDHRQTLTHIAAFKAAVRDFPKDWTKKGVPLGLKATAWIAGFPVNNTELRIGASGTLDFIGPSIDLGFRISRFADSRRFVLSADLALVMLDAIHNSECDSGLFQMHLLGREQLKGVIANKPYPIVWLDVNDGAPDIEEELLGIKRITHPDKLTTYLRKFLDSTPPLMRPFIAGDPDSKYGSIPPKLQAWRDRMEAEETDRGYLSPETGIDIGQEKAFKPPHIPDRDPDA